MIFVIGHPGRRQRGQVREITVRTCRDVQILVLVNRSWLVVNPALHHGSWTVDRQNFRILRRYIRLKRDEKNGLTHSLDDCVVRSCRKYRFW
jgi:hypothetical protein